MSRSRLNLSDCRAPELLIVLPLPRFLFGCTLHRENGMSSLNIFMLSSLLSGKDDLPCKPLTLLVFELWSEFLWGVPLRCSQLSRVIVLSLGKKSRPNLAHLIPTADLLQGVPDILRLGSSPHPLFSFLLHRVEPSSRTGPLYPQPLHTPLTSSDVSEEVVLELPFCLPWFLEEWS